MNYRDFSVEDVLKSGLNIKVENLPSLLKDKGIISTMSRKGYALIEKKDTYRPN